MATSLTFDLDSKMHHSLTTGDRIIFEVFYKAIAYNAIIQSAIALEMWERDHLYIKFYRNIQV
ncbi:MAG: hypothetical protein V7K18_22305 [Nostoc sp.]|uniref:hypothetical protein n=1 Tax=Nostoc sp. TaxID=1180 RepID=UPI002FF8B827